MNLVDRLETIYEEYCYRLRRYNNIDSERLEQNKSVIRDFLNTNKNEINELSQEGVIKNGKTDQSGNNKCCS